MLWNVEWLYYDNIAFSSIVYRDKTILTVNSVEVKFYIYKFYGQL